MSDVDQEIRDEEAQHQINWALWKRLFALARPYRNLLLAMTGCGFILAGAEFTLPLLTGRIIDAAQKGTDSSGVIWNALTYFLVAMVLPPMVFLFITLAGKITTGFAHDIRTSSFTRLQELSFSFYDEKNVGWLMARLTSDCGRVAGILPWMLLDLAWGFSMLIGISIMMLILQWQIALQVMLIVPPLIAISIYFQKKLIRSQRAVRRINSHLTSSFNEGIVGIRTTKSLAREDGNMSEFQELSSGLCLESIRNALQSAVYLPIVITLGSLGMGLALWRCGVSLNDGLSLGTLVTFIQYAALFYIPIQELARRFTQFQAAQASAERLQLLLDTEPKIKDSKEVLQRLSQTQSSKDSSTLAPDGYPDLIDEIEFNNVSFSYKKDETVLSSFNLRVKRGDRIALVGATGSGKTTVVNLLARFYEPTDGSILINGVDYRERGLHWLQSNLGMVLQTPHLFSGSIRENIRYGRLEASDAEVEEAARMAHADSFIKTLDKQFDTEIGEGGNRLSTGQKQLISLARAILARPQIFVMDEATSSIDTEMEQLIQQAIEKVLEGRISFVIAHRLSTVRSASKILVIDKGAILEQGTHQELLELKGRYYKLYTNQFLREQEEQALESGSDGK